MDHGGFYLRFDNPGLARRRMPLVRMIAGRACDWGRGLQLRGAYVYAPAGSNLSRGRYGTGETYKGDSLYQRICNAMAEEAMSEESYLPFAGVCGFASDGGELHAIEARFDGLSLEYALLQADARHLCPRCAVALASANDTRRPLEEQAALHGLQLALLQPAFSCGQDGCSVRVCMQRWEPDPEWPFGGRMPYVRVEESDPCGFDQPLMRRACECDLEACSEVAANWILEHSSDEDLMHHLADDPTEGHDLNRMTSYVLLDKDWLRIVQQVPALRQLALTRMGRARTRPSQG